MSDQWHYEQKGKSYIKVDTLHKIRTLESKLTAVTEQRDGLTKTCGALWFNELLRLASIKGITTSDDADCWWDDFNNGKTPQESMNEFLDSDEGLAFRDNCKQNDESSQLALVTEQRDRLADALRMYSLGYTEDDLNQLATTDSQMGEITPDQAQREIKRREALQSLNQNANLSDRHE